MSRHPPLSARIRPDEDRPEPPRLVFFGDPHGEFGPIEAVQRERPQAIVLLGDLQAERALHVELTAICALTEIWVHSRQSRHLAPQLAASARFQPLTLV